MTVEGYDAIIIGAGPNGLAAALRLAEAGHSTLVLEAAPTVGGGTRSAELTLPGYVHDVCAAVHALGMSSPVLAPATLGEHAPRWVWPDIPLAHPLDGGRAGVLHRDLDATAAGMGSDGSAWRRLLRPMIDNWDALAPQLLGPLLSVPRHPLLMARFGLKALQPADLLVRRFDGEEAAALFGGCAAHAFLSLRRPLTSAFGLMLTASAHVGGWPFAAGGSQSVADALAARLIELGGEIRTNTMVRDLDQLPSHRAVLFDTSPAQLAAIAGDALPTRYRQRLRRFRHGPAAYKVDYALSEPVPWTNESCRQAGTVHVVGTYAELAAAERDVASGRMPDRPLVLVAQPSLFDPSRAPSGQHTLWAYAHVPNGYAGDAGEAIERQLERFAPGFRDTVRARRVASPSSLEEYNPNYIGGDIAGGAHTGLQLMFRPTISRRPYVTQNPSVFLCSASTPPGAGVHGMCGWHAAGRVLASGRLRDVK